MMRFIRLTRDIHGFADPVLWLAVDHIISVSGNGMGTTIRDVSKREIDVVEKPAEVLAMIERADVVLATEARDG